MPKTREKFRVILVIYLTTKTYPPIKPIYSFIDRQQNLLKTTRQLAARCELQKANSRILEKV